MAYDHDLAERVRDRLGEQQGVTERAMFGGLGFMINGNMAVAVSGQGGLLVRCHPADTEPLTEDPHAERFAMRGREMDGWLHIDEEGSASERDLKRWVSIGVAYAGELQPK